MGVRLKHVSFLDSYFDLKQYNNNNNNSNSNSDSNSNNNNNSVHNICFDFKNNFHLHG